MTPFRPYQRQALEFFQAVPRGYLAGKPGSGKTAVALALAEWVLFELFETGAVLVVCPKRVVPQWAREARKWPAGQDLLFAEYVGAVPVRQQSLHSLMEHRANVLVCSFEFLPELLKAIPLHRWPFGLVIFDEASRLRDGGRQGSVTWKAVNAISRKTRSRLLLMSGSPRPGTAHELFGPVALLDGGATLGTTLGQFRAVYLEPDKTDRRSGRVFSWRLRRNMEAALYCAIRHLFFTVDPDLGLKSVEIDRWVDLPRELEAACTELQREQITSLAGLEVVALSQGAAFGKLHQLCQGAVFTDRNGNWQDLHTEKLDELSELLEEVDYEPVVICYWFEHDKDRLKRWFPHAVDLSTTDGLAAALRGEVSVALLHPASAGHGIDGLQDHFRAIVWFAVPASYELYDQTNKRLVRSGQKDTVRIFRILAANGIADRDLAKRLVDKEIGQEAFFYHLKADHA
jgi:hypothetical protein